MRPRYTLSAVFPCSGSRDRILKFERGHLRLTSFPEVFVAWQRDRDILVQRLDVVYSHVTKLGKVGVVAQNRPASVSGVIFAVYQF